MNHKSEIASIIIRGFMVLVSLGVSFMGFMILGMGEACCSLDKPSGLAYACFAWTITLALFVVLLYALWSPAKPIILWIWASTITVSLVTMNIQASHSRSMDLHLGQELQGLLSWWLTWALVGFVGLSHIEARFGTRTWDESSVQGA